jgi:hypothetical protein
VKQSLKVFSAYFALFALGSLAVGAIHPNPPVWAQGEHKDQPLDVKADGKAAIHILSANDDGEAVGEAVTSPLLAFRVEEGHLDQAVILDCLQETEVRQKESVDYPVVVLKCGALKLALVGVDLTVKK